MQLYADEEMRHSLRSLQTESVRPQLRMTDIVYVYCAYCFLKNDQLNRKFLKIQ